MGISPVNIVIGATASEAIAKFQTVNAELEKMESKALRAGGSISNLDKASRLASAALATVAIGAAAMGVASVKAAMESETAFARLNTAMTNAGVGSTANLEAAKKLAEANTKLGFTTIDTAQAYGTLITATGSTRDSQQLLNTAMDLARYKHESLAEAATTLARGTQGSARAFKEMGITLDSSLPKQEAINKAFDQLNQKLSGQNAAYLDTFAGKLSVLTAQFKLTEERIGGFLIPILTKLMTFIEKYGKDLLIFGGIVGGVALAIKAWEAATTAYLAVNAFMAVALAKQIAAQEAIAATALAAGDGVGGLAIADGLLATAAGAATGPLAAMSAVIDANPIGAMVVAVMALVGALYLLNKAFPSLTNSGGAVQSGVSGRGVGASARGNAGRHYDPTSGKWVADDASGSVSGSPEDAQSSFIKAASQNQSLDAFDKRMGFDLSSYTGKTSLTPAQKAAAAAAKKAATAAAAAAKKAAAASVIANKSELAEVSKLGGELTKANAKYLSDLAANQFAFNVSQTAAQITRDDANRSAQKTFNDYMLAENKRYTKEKEKLFQSNADQVTAINKTGADQLAAIVKTSVDLLRNAFAGATKFDVGSIFAANLSSLGSTLSTQIKNGITTVVSWWGTANGSGITAVITDLSQKLIAAKKLSDDAGRLAGLGYSQTFIQQIVSQGAGLGDQISQAILKATPTQQKQLKDLYSQLDATSNNGVDALAKSMSTPGQLATDALNQQYSTAQALLATNLAKQKDLYDDASATALASFNTNIGAAEVTRDTALAAASDAFRTAMNTANQTLSAANTAAQTSIKTSLTAIATEFDTKLASVKSNIASTVAAIATLKAAIASSQTLATQSPNTLVPFATQNKSSNDQRNNFVNDYNNSSMGGTLVINAPISVDGSTAPADIATAVTGIIKYGSIAGGTRARTGD